MRKDENVFITRSFLPPIRKYQKYLKEIWKTNQLTNQGPLVKKLESKLRAYLKVKNLHFVTNGTVALQLAFETLDISKGEIITTPFSYVASVSSILWERCEPVFVDIEKNTFCIDAEKIEKAITKNTKAILGVHVFGFPCNVEKIGRIAKQHNLRVIYDGAHAFGVKYRNKSLLDYGDISTCSFHATKLFHTAEGGSVILKEKKLSDKLELMKRFGHHGDNHYRLGINAKASELQAAMGLCNLEYVSEIIKIRKKAFDLYNKFLGDKFQKPKITKNLKYNYAYYPILFRNKKETSRIIKALNNENIFPRRYFYPSLNTLPYLKKYQSCPISEDISSRILCLPLYVGLKEKVIKEICRIIRANAY